MIAGSSARGTEGGRRSDGAEGAGVGLDQKSVRSGAARLSAGKRGIRSVTSGSRVAAPGSGSEASPESARADQEVGSSSAGDDDHEAGSLSAGPDCGGSLSQENSSAWPSAALAGVPVNAASNGPRASAWVPWLPLTDLTWGSGTLSQPVPAPQLPARSRPGSGSAGWS